MWISPLQVRLILNYDWLRLTQCLGSCIGTIYSSPVEVRASTIDEAVSAGLRIARDLLGSVDRYCLYEVIIEYWHGNELSAKLIYADDPARALITTTPRGLA